MTHRLVEKIDRENMRRDGLPDFRVGDLLKVQVRIREGDKERLQSFSGTVIARDGGGASETVTLRRLSHGVGVERVFPLHSPHLAQIEVQRSSRVRRAKLYYLRERTGKKARLREKIRQSRGTDAAAG